MARLLIVGADEMARTVMRTVVANPALGYEIIGFVDDVEPDCPSKIGRFQFLGGLRNFGRILKFNKIDEVIVTLSSQHHTKIMEIISLCEKLNIQVYIVPELFQMSFSQVSVTNIAGLPLVTSQRTSISGTNLMFKRAIDVLASGMALTVLSPFMALIAWLIQLESEGPIIFTQTRIGKNGKPFTFYKFRSMVKNASQKKAELQALNESDGPLFKMKHDPRITRLGKFLRRYSLDELPQLYNVFRGDMSLVGPRPNEPAEVANYESWHKRRLDVLPGLTSLWVISGRSDLTFDEMAMLDIYYLENWSVALDIRIILQTIPLVITGRGAY